MMKVEPIFITRPEGWNVTSCPAFILELTPAASAGFRHINTGCSYRGIELHLKVPMGWHEDRVNAFVARFRAEMDVTFSRRRTRIPLEDEE